MNYLFYTVSDPGKQHALNQDRYYAKSNGSRAVLCVADGMGGHAHGEFASEEIVTQVEEWANMTIFREDFNTSFSDACDSLDEQIIKINKDIYQKYNQDAICGSTIVVLLLYESSYAVFSFGDSRLYLKRRHSFQQITQDHVWQNQVVLPDILTKEDLKKHPDYDKLTSAIGVEEKIVVSRSTGVLKPKDMFIMCSDGIYKFIAEKAFRNSFNVIFRKRGEQGLESIANNICKKVIENGAPDNYTLIIAEAY